MRGERRRDAILKSLQRCILNKGSLKTTLAEIAEGAGMTASHLLYYFKGKEDILEYYFKDVSACILTQIENLGGQCLEERINLLADFWFDNDTRSRQEISVLLELFGAAVNDDALKFIKTNFDTGCKAILANFFKQPEKNRANNSRDAVELAYSIMIGLRTTIIFDDSISLRHARSLFQQTLRNMSELSVQETTYEVR